VNATTIESVKLTDLTDGQEATARLGRYVDGLNEPQWGPWQPVKLYVVRRVKPLPAHLRRRTRDPNVGDIITLVATQLSSCEFSQSDFEQGTFNTEGYYLQIQNLEDQNDQQSPRRS
jgi:hypothetical protein